MALPKITFFCEVEASKLQELFDDKIIADLLALKASVSLGILDLSPERENTVARLNRAGVPVIAWLLLPRDQGYWFNLYNVSQAYVRYTDVCDWAKEHDLVFSGFGLDIEPDMRELSGLTTQRWRTISAMLLRTFNRKIHRKARKEYQALVAQIQADGYPVDSYQFPIINDERRAGSTFLQRLLGLVDIDVDREVWMLYSNFLRPHGAGLIASYAPEAQAIGLGSTGGGVDVEFGNFPALRWDEFERDLRLAWNWCNDLHIFSLEGCVQHGYLSQLRKFAWDYPILIPESSQTRVDGWRYLLQSGLWLTANMTKLLLGFLAVYFFIRRMQRFIKRKSIT